MKRWWIAAVVLMIGAQYEAYAAEAPDAASAPAAETAPKDTADGDAATGGPQFKSMSGMSVLGNNEAPKSLVIVPWKSSQIGDGIGVLNSLDNRPQPVDREVFARELDYYQIRTGPQAESPAPVRVGSR